MNCDSAENEKEILTEKLIFHFQTGQFSNSGVQKIYKSFYFYEEWFSALTIVTSEKFWFKLCYLGYKEITFHFVGFV